jgi:superfamily II DNA or RNA helicase
MIEDTIIVENLNNSFLQIDTDPAIAKELSAFFSFMTPNYYFMPKYKNGMWDGKTRLYKILGSTLPSGLYGVLVKFAQDNEYEIIDRRTPSKLEQPSEEYLDTFLKRLKPHVRGEEIEHYDYQLESVKLAIRNERTTILSSTSSGKSLIIYSLIRWYQKRVNGKILVMVPTVNLVEQMCTDFDDYASEEEWRSENYIHKIMQGKKKFSEKTIYVSTWQSIYKMPKNYFEQFDVILCDEVHGASAESIVGIMEKSVNAFVRVGFTGTLKDMKLHQLTIVGLFGDIVQVSTNRELMDRGIITNLDVKFCMLKYSDSICKEITRKKVEKISPGGKKIYRNNYTNEMDYITSCVQRNLYIAKLAEVLPGNVLILFNKVQKHGKPLYKLLLKRLDNKKNVHYISGETKVDNREKIRGTIEKETNSVLIASYGTLSTGVNIRSLQFVIFASPYKSEIKVLQSIGRILRKCKGKKKAVLFDLVDDFRHKKKVNFAYKHFAKRFDIYKKEKFPISVTEYKLL